jgi:hypothetical protein
VAIQPNEWCAAPIQVVRYAQALFENSDCHKRIQRHAFEKVYAVFGLDDHDGPDKGAGNAFSITRDHVPAATQRAERLSEGFTPRTEPEPHTAIVELASLLITLRG